MVRIFVETFFEHFLTSACNSLLGLSSSLLVRASPTFWMTVYSRAIGAVVITVAKTQDYLLAGRFVLGFGVSITTTAAPAYVVEMSPPQWRGRLTGL